MIAPDRHSGAIFFLKNHRGAIPLPINEIDDEYINQILLFYPNGTRLLAALLNPDSSEQLPVENVEHVLANLKKH